MDKKIKVSVLVPICNVEKYLAECLDSLIGQTLEDIEIICIDDGSTDNSPKIIAEYAKKDKRIKVITKPNSGYGDSMNKGLALASGDFVGIVESDDFIDTDAFEKLYNLAVQNEVDVVKSNFYEYFGSTKTDKRTSNLFLPDEINKVINPRIKHNIFYQPPCIWAAIYRRDFLLENKIDFLPTPGASYQDTGFNLKVWSSTRRAYFTDRAFLHYRQDNSSSSVKSSGKIYCVKKEYDSVEEFLKKNNIDDGLFSVITTCRFGAYVWNLHRLSFKSAMQFARTVKKDYKHAKKSGYLALNKLDEVGKYNSRLVAIRFPKIYVIFRPLHDLRNKNRALLQKIMTKISPKRRQQEQTIKIVEQLRESQNELKTKIKQIESEMEDKNEK